MNTPLRLPYERELATPVGRLKELVKRALALTSRQGGTLLRVQTREPAIALTFDDGPQSADTPPVLDILERHGAFGTFFLVGKSAAAHPQLVERLVRGGHAIGNHGWDHASFPRLQRAEQEAQLERAQAALGPGASRLFRPPFGEQDSSSASTVRSQGYPVVLWDVVAEDWQDHPAPHIVERVMRRLRRGSIVVFHDTLYVAEEPRYRDRAPMRAALETILGRLSGEFRFVTVPELLTLGRPVWGHHRHRVSEEYLGRLRPTSRS